MSRGFGSDNHSGAHPRILAKMSECNIDHEPAYGTDRYTEEAQKHIRRHFGAKAEAHFVFNGTAANVLSLGAFLKAHHAILSAQTSHIINDECGAPERILGLKIISVPSTDGKLRPDDLRKYLIRKGDQHASQVKAVSITQPTEVGTVYSPNELREMAAFCKENGLLFHVDGARLVNAAESLSCEVIGQAAAGADVVSLGGTKNGLVFGEAVVFPNGTPEDFKYLRKQTMQLPSKTRFVAAQFLEFIGTDLWRENAKVANQMAELLAQGLAESPYAKMTQKREANGCFVILPKKIISRLREHYFFYVWDEHTFECRLMTSWDTKQEDIEGFLKVLDREGAN